ncbi:MAG: DUF1015 family protein [Bacillota bacterium]
MAIIKAFKAIRPISELAARVAALPYDVMDSQEARAMAKGNPYSFLHIDKAEINLPLDVELHSQVVYEKAAENYKKFKREGVFLQDSTPSFYIYQQTMAGRTQRGLVACVSVDDYLDNRIKKHELTRMDKEMDRTRHIEYCNAHTGPIFLTYLANSSVSQLLQLWIENNQVIYDFISEDGVRHQVWQINRQKVVEQLVNLLQAVSSLYIADGHHRAASAVNVALKKRRDMTDPTGQEDFNYFPAVLFPSDELEIMDYNRVVKDLNGLTEKEFMQKIGAAFTVEEALTKPFRPKSKQTFGMYLAGRWYKLTAKEGSFDSREPVSSLAVSILQNNLLEPILGIADPRTDDRIDFVGGIRGLVELEKRVKEGMKVAFSLYPTTIQELMEIADADRLMPPKSTWFEPKLRSGLFIHELD